MLKDNCRDYAVEAFRFYGAVDGDETGCVSEAEREDVRAVSECLDALDNTERGVIEYIYLTDCREKIPRNEISRRVTRAALEYNVSESYVYRMLRKARLDFALRRGLRLE